MRILPFERELACEPGESVLDAALRAGLYLRYGCRTGGCGTCKMRLVEGEVKETRDTFSLAGAEREDGWFLACASTPLEDCVIDAGAMDLTESELLAGDRPAAFSAELVSNVQLTRDVHALRLALVEPSTMQFVAGQFVNVELPGSSDVRSYSIANAPSDTSYLDFIVKRRPRGRFSSLIEDGRGVGMRLRVEGPFGQLRVRSSHRPIIMVASGSGLSPMLSMLTELMRKGNSRPVRLFFSVRTAEDVFALDRLEAFARGMPGFEFRPVLAESSHDVAWDAGPLAGVLARRLGSAKDHDAYLCGSAGCIEAALPALLELGIRRRNVHFDVFTPAR